jgi:hypothetical protein
MRTKILSRDGEEQTETIVDLIFDTDPSGVQASGSPTNCANNILYFDRAPVVGASLASKVAEGTLKAESLRKERHCILLAEQRDKSLPEEIYTAPRQTQVEASKFYGLKAEMSSSAASRWTLHVDVCQPEEQRRLERLERSQRDRDQRLDRTTARGIAMLSSILMPGVIVALVAGAGYAALHNSVKTAL